MKLFNLLTFVFVINSTYSQTFEEYKKRYPKEDVITSLLIKHIEIKNKKGKLDIKEYVTKSNYYLTDKNLATANENIHYNSFNSIEKIVAYTKNLDDNYSKSYYVDKFIDKNVLTNGVFFNDQKEKTFTFPNVNKGAVTEIQYVRNIKDSHFIPAFIIYSTIPIEQVKLSISFPENVEVNFKDFNLDTIQSSFTKSIDKNITTFKWTINRVKKANINYDFSPLYYIPQVITYIKSQTLKNGVKKNILSDPHDLYQWYQSLITNINKTNQSKLKAITLDLIKDAKSDIDKIERIYYYVQDKISYIAFEDGLNGFIPRDAYNVFINKYGDCKDMANILNEMLHYAGITSYLTWIGTRDRPYTYKEVFTPLTDNHMITAVELKNKIIFLDATAKYLPLHYPSPFIQGKEALVGINKKDFKIIKVPEVEAQKNTFTLKSHFKFKNTTLKGTHHAEFMGYEKLFMLHKIKKKSLDDLSFLQNTIKLGLKKTNFDSINYQNLALDKEKLKITFKTFTPAYSKLIDDKIYFKPNFDFQMKSEIVKNEKKLFDKKIEYQLYKNFESIFELPESYQIDYLPKNVYYRQNNLSFSLSYKLSENKKQLILSKNIEVNTLKISTQEISLWNKFIKSLNRANKQNIILKKI